MQLGANIIFIHNMQDIKVIHIHKPIIVNIIKY